MAAQIDLWPAGAPNPTSAPGPHSVPVARQPIVDRVGAVVAYELLFRSDDPTGYSRSGEYKTTQVMSGTLTAGIGRMSNRTRLFCNADRGLLTGTTPMVLPPHSTTIEVLETVHVDEEVLDGCRRLIAQGYQIALDDFQWSPRAPELLRLATVVKLDLMAHPRPVLERLAAQCRSYDVLVLAEKVETADDVAWAHAAGFDLFQGYAIDHPEVVRVDTVAPSTLTLVRLAAHLASAELDMDDLEQLLRLDPGLSLQVLHLASAGAARGLRRPVHSVRQALVLMGTARVSTWAALAIMSSIPTPAPDGYLSCLSRARTCELLAARVEVDPASAFTAGLLSGLGILLGVPAHDLHDRLELDPVLKAAAFARVGPTGAVVGRAIDLETLTHNPTSSDGALTDLVDIAAEAFTWALDRAEPNPADPDASHP